jgi:DNA end-binding protein Ku
VDRYEEALKALIAEKQKGHKPARVAEPEDTNVIDLMSALRASLAGKAAAGPKTKPVKSAPKSPASKPKARKAS